MSEITRYNDILNTEYAEGLDIYQGNDFTEIEVFVESFEDIGFWYSILAPYEKLGFRFNINIPSVTNLKMGKQALLNLIKAQNLGKHLILCVDSDYDYLLQNTTENSTIINTNPYIFQTYTYSIENFYCYAESLQTVVTQATKSTQRFIDIEKFIAQYSKIIYPLFVWSVHFHKIQNFSHFTIEDFCSIVKFERNIDIFGNGTTELNQLDTNIKTKIQEFEQSFPNEITKVEELKVELNTLGLTEENTYLFIQGHLLKDNVVLMFLNPLFDVLKTKTHQDVSQSNVNLERKNDVRNEFLNIINDIKIKTALELNTEFKNCLLFQKLNEELKTYINSFSTTV